MRRLAFHEAVSHLGKAIEIADRTAEAAPGTAGGGPKPVTRERQKLQTDYGQAVMWSKGCAAEETKAALERAHSLLSIGNGNHAERCISIYSQWVGKLAARGVAAIFEVIRGKARAARTAALISSEVGREHGMRFYVALATW